MAILANSEQRHVEGRAPHIESLAAVKLLQSRLVGYGRVAGRQAFCGNGMDVVPREWYQGEESFMCHPVVAVGMLARHKPFVTPEPVRSRPREGGAARCERFVKLAWRRSTRQTDGKAPLTCESRLADPIGGRPRGIVDDRENLPVGSLVFAHRIAT